MTTLIVRLKKYGEVVIYFDGNVNRTGMIDEEGDEGSCTQQDLDQWLTIKPLTKLPKKYRKRFNIKE